MAAGLTCLKTRTRRGLTQIKRDRARGS